MGDTIISVSAGKPYGHVPGHTYVDADLTVEKTRTGYLATIIVTWGSAQGHDEEHGRHEYACRGGSVGDAIERVADEAVHAEAELGDTAACSYIRTAKARALDKAGQLASDEEASP